MSHNKIFAATCYRCGRVKAAEQLRILPLAYGAEALICSFCKEQITLEESPDSTFPNSLYEGKGLLGDPFLYPETIRSQVKEKRTNA